jgi:hypothetical protein
MSFSSRRKREIVGFVNFVGCFGSVQDITSAVPTARAGFVTTYRVIDERTLRIGGIVQGDQKVSVHLKITTHAFLASLLGSI